MTFKNNFPSDNVLLCHIEKNHVKHHAFWHIRGTSVSLYTCCIFFFPDFRRNIFTCAIQKCYVKTGWCYVVSILKPYLLTHSSTDILFTHISCLMLCDLSLSSCDLSQLHSFSKIPYGKKVINDTINISSIILCVSYWRDTLNCLQSPVAIMILSCLFCSTNCFILQYTFELLK